MRGLERIEMALLGQRGHLFVWLPVCLAIGIGGFFALRSEPGLPAYGVVVASGMVAAVVAGRWPGGLGALGWALAFVALGFCLAGSRAHRLAAPVLEFRYYGPVEGRIVAIDRSASDALRLTLDRVHLDRVPPWRIPERVRISLHGEALTNIIPGARIMTTAHLSPPNGPAEPGGFDFRRHAWFQQLGAVGYTRVPVLLAAPAAANRAGVRVLAVRIAISERVRTVLAGDTGGFAAAVTTGDRSGISQDALQALRRSNLAHLLAISGLHMGLLAGFVFAAIRFGFAAIPYVALRWPTRKIAAVTALAGASGYLLLSGGNVATERAFIMVAVALCALLFDRRALSLRAVAVAAMIVLTLRPEALLSPGFQMSFAATTALVAVFGWLRDAPFGRAPKWAQPVLSVVISSAVAGAATGPIGAAHFNTMSHYGLIANLVSVPLMGLVVIPPAVLALFLAPFGLESFGLAIMGLALDWILGVAHWVSGLEGAVGFVVAPGQWVLPLLSLGLLWVILWQGRARWAGLAPAMLAMWMWSETARPDVLVSDTGSLIGVMTETGRALSRSRGSGFVAGIWLENDGDGVPQPVAAARWPGEESRIRIYPTDGREFVHVSSKRAAATFARCTVNQVVIASVEASPEGGCDVYDLIRLRRTGSVAFYADKPLEANTVSGARIWNSRAARRYQ